MEEFNNEDHLSAAKTAHMAFNNSEMLLAAKSAQIAFNNSGMHSAAKAAQKTFNNSGMLSAAKAAQMAYNNSGMHSAAKAAQMAYNNSGMHSAAKAAQMAFNNSGMHSAAKAAKILLTNSNMLLSVKAAQFEITNSIAFKAITQINSNIYYLNIYKSDFHNKIYDDEPITKTLIDIENKILLNYKNINNSNIENTFRNASIKDNNISEEALIKQLNIIENNLIESIEKSKPSVISIEGFLGIVLAIVFFIYSQISTTSSMDMVDTQFDELEKKTDIILEYQEKINQNIIERLSSNENEELRFIGTRPTKSKSRPSNKSTTIAILPPGCRVKVKEHKNKWILVIYFDYLDEVIYQGWILKKYSKK
ncbi:MAG: hypothetical protein U5P10_14920 [Spirochaetia bacterium]|nr:hypothetical protein [Spirochaetia bacterium]